VEPPLKKYPAEYFGFPYTERTKEIEELRAKQHCPFLDVECKKPRKSQPEVKIGVCTLGYRPDFSKNFHPVIICSYRFQVPSVFEAIEKNYLPNSKSADLVWVPEVSIGVGGSVDYVLAKRNKLDEFICVETQAAGTTGTPWEAVQEYRKTGTFSRESYGVGINWANEFVKTMMQQAYKKGLIVESWRKKIVFALQDIGLEYMNKNNDTGGLHDPKDEDPIHFCIFKMVWSDAKKRWDPIFQRRMSTDTDGVRRILGGAPEGAFLSSSDFVENVRKTMKKKGIGVSDKKQVLLS